MKKNLIVVSSLVLMSIMVISFVSAGWFADIFGGAPPRINSKGVSYSPSSFTLADLSAGVQLKFGWNYWYTWQDKDMSIEEIVSRLPSESVLYVYAYDVKTKSYLYWYNDKYYPTKKDQITTFTKGNMYALYMKSAQTWKYAESLAIEHDIGDLKISYSDTTEAHCESDDFEGAETYLQGCLLGSRAKYKFKEDSRETDVIIDKYSINNNGAYQWLNALIQEEKIKSKVIYLMGGYVYYLNDSSEAVVIWQSGNYLIGVSFSTDLLNSYGDDALNQLVKAYLTKYPSDLNANSPVPEVPSDNETDTSSSAVTYKDCYKKGASTTDWGSNLYNNTEFLTNSASVECNSGEKILISDFTCNPRFWYQKNPVYVQGVSMFYSPDTKIEGRTLTCTGGESQGILNIICCSA